MSIIPPRPSLLAPGLRLDRYELLCPIAEGGMASVWIARQTGKHGFQRLVAVKTILPKYASEPRFQQMFVDEARIASRIQHVNVAQILDVGEQHEVTYLVMEYVDGDALSKVYRAAEKSGVRIPAGIVLRVMADVSGGLHAAHELRDSAGQPLGVVHRDVSPQNVLLSTQGVAKLIDFGIAKARDRLAGDTNTDQLKGKVQYMAPEQALARPMDRRADVWAVGAVLYHLLVGKPPFEAENEVQSLFLLASGKPPAPLPPSVPAAVAAVVRKALSNAPDRRYATASELQQAIEAAMVEAHLTTTTAAVAAFLEKHAGERAKKRRDAIALGLQAADQRDAVAALMKSNTEKVGQGSASGVDAAGLAAAEPPSTPGGTLGSTALPVPSRPRSRGLLAIVAGAAGLGLGLAVILMLGLARSSPVGTGAGSGAASGPPIASEVPSTSTSTAAPSVSTPPLAGASATTSATSIAPVARPPSPPPVTTSKHRGNYGF
jgi:serine/threonine-protein kinase